jgi:Bacterial regulatory proteins, luxR family
VAAGRVLVAALGGLGQVNQGPGPHVRVIGGVLRVEDPGQVLVGLVVTAGAERRGSAGELNQGQQRGHAPHLTTHEIARELCVSVNTVSTHRRHLYTKLGVHSRREAVDRGRVLGLLAPSARRA